MFRDAAGKWIVYEGAGRADGQKLDIDAWQRHETGNDSKLHPIYVRRMPGLAAESLAMLKAKAGALHETNYDFAFAWENSNPDNHSEYIYCSELIWKAYDQAIGLKLGTPHPLRDYYEQIADGPKQREVKRAFELILNSARAKTRRGGRDYDPSELAISPREVFESEKLVPVTNGE